MFLEHPYTAEIDEVIREIDPHVRREIEATFRAYAELLKVANRDREVVLGVIDRVGVRLDEVHPHPDMPAEAAVARVMQAFDNYIEDQREVARAGGVAYAMGGGDDGDFDPDIGTMPPRDPVPLGDWYLHPDGFFGRRTFIRSPADNEDEIALMIRGKTNKWSAYYFGVDFDDEDIDAGRIDGLYGSPEEAKEAAEAEAREHGEYTL